MRLAMTQCGGVVVGILLSALAVRSAPCAPAGEAGAIDGGDGFQRQEPFVVRPFDATRGDRWIGNGVAYGPFRDGQSPGGASPSGAELLEDLELMARHWSLMRLYGATGPTATILELIRQNEIGMQVMLGAWIDAEERHDAHGAAAERRPEVAAVNRQEIEAAIGLANAYPDIVVAVNVGNETQVSWSSHRVPAGVLIELVREVRARTTVPVTVADDSSFWGEPASRQLAGEIDFIVTHIHPLWGGQRLAEALDWTQRMYARVVAAHPDRQVAIGETGWATRKHDVGEQARLIQGQPGEEQQAVFHDALTAWTLQERITTFFFEAFDENWKGGEHPDEVEKHWGLFRADRSPKRAMTDGT
ncbi:MAG: glycosyl hydrolase family 17 protein [Candidatus Eiseniibacteriota bacterium]|jgi:exo-beta-1,3-glucanase (GH17 family)